VRTLPPVTGSLATTKRCSTCKRTLSVDSFYKNAHRADGRHTQCSECSRRNFTTWRSKLTPEKKVERHRKWLLAQYGMTLEDFEEMAEEQDYSCAICLEVRALVVDHNHETGEVRGLLCNECNMALGKFRDDPGLLRRAMCYLRRNR
jgi:hypothetical protein